MNFYAISKKVKETSITYRKSSNSYIMRPYVDGQRYFFSGKTKSEVKKKMSDFLTENYGDSKDKKSKEIVKEPADLTEEDDSSENIAEQVPCQDTDKNTSASVKCPAQGADQEDQTAKAPQIQRSDELARLMAETARELIEKAEKAAATEKKKANPLLDTIGQNTWLYEQQPQSPIFNYSATPLSPNISQEFREFCKKGIMPDSSVGNGNSNYSDRVPNRNKDSVADPYRITLNEYIEYWLLHYKKPMLEPSSYERMAMIYKYHIENTIGRKPIATVTEQDVQLLINSKANPYDGSEPMALSGLKKIRELLRPCMERAVIDGLIMVNPCRGLIMPKERYLKKKTKKQFSMDDEQIRIFDEACRMKFSTTGEYRTRDGLVLLFILNLGLRVGEALALKWSDIDFSAKLIHIERTIQYSRQYGETEKDGTKTPSGNRILPLNDTVRNLLDEMRAYDTRNHIESEYVCCSVNGTRKNNSNLQRSMDRILKHTSISHISLHTLRHTFGSTMLRRGINVEVVSKLMGHANITITYNKYIHVIREQEAKSMNVVSIT